MRTTRRAWRTWSEGCPRRLPCRAMSYWRHSTQSRHPACVAICLAGAVHPVQLPISSIVERQFHTGWQGPYWHGWRFLLALAKGSLLLLAPWQAIRHEAIRSPPHPAPPIRHWARTRLAGKNGLAAWKRGKGSVTQHRRMVQRSKRTVGASTATWRDPAVPRQRRRSLRYTQTCFRHWSRQQRAVKAVVDLEFEMANVAIDLTAACEQGLDSLEARSRLGCSQNWTM